MGLPAQINRRDSFQLAGRLDVQVLGQVAVPRLESARLHELFDRLG